MTLEEIINQDMEIKILIFKDMSQTINFQTEIFTKMEELNLIMKDLIDLMINIKNRINLINLDFSTKREINLIKEKIKIILEINNMINREIMRIINNFQDFSKAIKENSNFKIKDQLLIIDNNIVMIETFKIINIKLLSIIIKEKINGKEILDNKMKMI